MERPPTRRTIVRNLVRAHVIKLNKCLYDKETPVDDFILYRVADEDCRVDAVILHVDDEFFSAPQSWVALMIQGKPYLISRKDCASLPRTDDTIYVDIRLIINIPFDEQDPDNMVIDNNSRTNTLLSSSTQIKATTPSFYERFNETIIRPMRRKHAIFVDTPYQLFSLARHINEGSIHESLYQTDNELAQYLKIVIDYSLIGSNFANKEHRLILENKLLAYYNNVLMQNNETMLLVQQHKVFLEFMLNVILCETELVPLDVTYFEETSERYQHSTQIKCKMMNECIAWEIFKLKRSRDRFSVNHYQRLIDEFLSFIDKTIQNSLIPRPEWTLYYINKEKPNLFWHSDKHDILLIRFEWLPLLIKEGLSSVIQDRLRQGTIWLNTNEFYDYFLPCLYRAILTDSFRFIWMCRLSHREDKFVRSLVAIEQENFKTLIWQALPVVTGASSNALLEYSNGSLTHITSPITKKIAKRDRMIPRGRSTNNKPVVNYATQVSLIATEVDIEEINQFMPPCIKSVIKKNTKLGNGDRFTAIYYLIDMGYTKEDAIRLLNGTNKIDITQAYLWQKKKKSPDRLSSLCCDGMIALDGSMGQTTRCPYEEAANGPKRRKKEEHSHEDKDKYRIQCSATLGPNVKRIISPIDYIRHKMNDM